MALTAAWGQILPETLPFWQQISIQARRLVAL
jgi:hypothetical protein